MEQLLENLRSYGRLLELEDSIPYWESQIPELKDRMTEMKWNQQQKETELLTLQEPNMFQRIFGRAEEKKEKLVKQIREITAARTAAQWELDDLEKQIAAGKQEVAALAESREAYETARNALTLSAAQESRLLMEQISVLAPVALEAAWHVLTALENARPWMQQDAVRKGVSEKNRKMECLLKAEEAAARLRNILEALPEGVATVGSYLQSPHDYIYGVTSEFKQLDRLERAQEQIRTIRTQLKLLLGE